MISIVSNCLLAFALVMVGALVTIVAITIAEKRDAKKIKEAKKEQKMDLLLTKLNEIENKINK